MRQLDYEVDLVGPVRPNTSWQAKSSGEYDNSQFSTAADGAQASTGTHTQLLVLKVRRVPLGLQVKIGGGMLELTSNSPVQYVAPVIFGLYVLDFIGNSEELEFRLVPGAKL